MRGRKPKPVAVKIAEGDRHRRGVHVLDAMAAAEPQAERGLPKCPRHLVGRARHAWNFWAEALELMALDHRPDAMMLEGAATNYAKAVTADEDVRKNGIVIEESALDPETGRRVVLRSVRNPADVVSNRAWALVHKFCSEFGLSPVSRTRLAVEDRSRTRAPRTTLMEKLSAPRPLRPPGPLQ